MPEFSSFLPAIFVWLIGGVWRCFWHLVSKIQHGAVEKVLRVLAFSSDTSYRPITACIPHAVVCSTVLSIAQQQKHSRERAYTRLLFLWPFAVLLARIISIAVDGALNAMERSGFAWSTLYLLSLWSRYLHGRLDHCFALAFDSQTDLVCEKWRILPKEAVLNKTMFHSFAR